MRNINDNQEKHSIIDPLNHREAAPLLRLLHDPDVSVRTSAFRAVILLLLSPDLRLEVDQSVIDLLMAMLTGYSDSPIPLAIPSINPVEAEFRQPAIKALAAISEKIPLWGSKQQSVAPVSTVTIQSVSHELPAYLTLEKLRGTFQEANDVNGRLYPALTLASVGESEHIEMVLRELEQRPLDFSLLRYVREDRSEQFPPTVVKQFTRIAVDGSRRGDIRQLAFILSQRSRVTAPDFPTQETSVPPECVDLQEHATALADSYLDRLAVEFVEPTRDDMEVLRYLNEEVATVLITSLFAGLLEAALAQDQGYMAGNRVARLVASFGPTFIPDIPALFEVYIRMHERVLPAREEWYRTRDDYVIFNSTGYLAASWQLCWTVSRAGIRHVLLDLTPALASPDVPERLAALQCIEDAIRYAPFVYPPEFGGGSGPPEIKPQATSIKQEEGTRFSRKQAEVSEHEKVQVFYGTDRKRSGRDQPMTYYLGERGEELQVGMCEVSIPKNPKHKTGNMETPAWWKFEIREDPNEHIVLSSVKSQSREEFSRALEQVVKHSKEKQVLLFVHGYRVTFADAARRTAQLAYDLDIGVVPIFYSWPSEGRYFSYGADRENAENAVPYLKSFLATIAHESGAKTVHLIAHSMGNETLTRAIREFSDAPATADGLLFKDIVLTAPDIDADIFKNQIVPKIRGKASRITLYASRKDRALWASKVFRRGYQRAGDTSNSRIVVIEGIDTIDASAVDTSYIGHSYFAENRSVVSDLFSLLRHGLSPDKRYGLRLKTHPDGRYWVLQ